MVVSILVTNQHLGVRSGEAVMIYLPRLTCSGDLPVGEVDVHHLSSRARLLEYFASLLVVRREEGMGYNDHLYFGLPEPKPMSVCSWLAVKKVVEGSSFIKGVLLNVVSSASVEEGGNVGDYLATAPLNPGSKDQIRAWVYLGQLPSSAKSA